MQFQKFEDFLKQRQTNEGYDSSKLNRSAMGYSNKLAAFNTRFPDPKEGEKVIQAAGYKSVGDFVSDPDDRKWSKLKIPGQQNYVRR